MRDTSSCPGQSWYIRAWLKTMHHPGSFRTITPEKHRDFPISISPLLQDKPAMQSMANDTSPDNQLEQKSGNTLDPRQDAKESLSIT
jgi:hypothetical protein